MYILFECNDISEKLSDIYITVKKKNYYQKLSVERISRSDW